jgi:hypothetical protein
MAVYVDNAAHGFGRMIMCHMFSPNLGELHAMADRIGIARKCFQNPATMPKVSWPHYDIARSKRALAVSYGAIECDKYCMVAMAAVIEGKPDPLRLIRPLADTTKAFAPAAHVPAWLAAQGYPQDAFPNREERGL